MSTYKNYKGFGMVFLRGERENVEKLFDVFADEDSSSDHFYRIHLDEDAPDSFSETIKEDSSGKYVTCSFGIEYDSWLRNNLDKGFLKKYAFGVDPKTCLSIEEASKEYNVDIEIYGFDVDNHLEEHLIAVDGDLIISKLLSGRIDWFMDFDDPDSVNNYPGTKMSSSAKSDSLLHPSYVFNLPISMEDLDSFYDCLLDWTFTLEKMIFADNKEDALKNLGDNPWSYKYLPRKLKADKDIAKAALTMTPSLVGYIPKKAFKDKGVLLAFVENASSIDEDRVGRIYKGLPKDCQKDKDIVIKLVSCHGSVLEYVCETMRSDKEVVLTAVNSNGDALKFVSSELKSDKEVVMAAVKNKGWALQYASDKFKSDKEVVMAAVKNRGWALEYASEELKSDKEVVLAAVAESGSAMKYASKELRSDKEFFISAVKIGGNLTIEYGAPKKIAEDPDILALLEQQKEEKL